MVKRFVLMLAGMLLAGSLVVVYGCPTSEQGGNTGAGQTGAESHEGHDHAEMPEGHPQVGDMEGMQGMEGMQQAESQPLNPAGEPMEGTWARVGNPGSTIRVTIDEGRLVYHGAWGDAPLVKIDDTHASGNMGGMPINLSLTDGVLSVELVGFNEVYQYEKAG